MKYVGLTVCPYIEPVLFFSASCPVSDAGPIILAVYCLLQVSRASGGNLTNTPRPILPLAQVVFEIRSCLQTSWRITPLASNGGLCKAEIGGREKESLIVRALYAACLHLARTS